MNDIDTNYLIRPAVPADAHSIANLVKDAELSDKIAAVSMSDMILRIESAIELCGEDKNDNIFVVVDNDGQILAYAVIQWHIALFLPCGEGYISELTVRTDRRGYGIGSMLLNHLMDMAKKRNCTRMSLINSRFRDSYKRKFYNKHGWYEREVAANFVYEF